MDWTAQLAGKVKPPVWAGPTRLCLNLSMGDEVSEDLANEPSMRLTCTKCKRVLPATPDHFFRNRRERTGLMGECKECHKARDRTAAQKRYEAKKVLSAREFSALSGEGA
jgi:hypothetical protein